MSDLKFRISATEGRSTYFQHDERGDSRAVKFKNNRGGRRGGGTYKDFDGDVKMGEQDVRKPRFAPYIPSKKQYRDGGGRRRRRDYSQDSVPGPSAVYSSFRKENQWFRIIIPYGRNLEKNFILKSLTEVSDIPFIPIHFHTEGNAVIFYVDDQNAARALGRVSKQVTTPEGFKMQVRISPANAPVIPLDETVLEKIKLCMSKRFNTDTSTLDLSTFHLDPDFKRDGIFAPLARHNVMSKVVNIIQENIPQLQALDLSRNKLVGLESLGRMMPKFKNLKILILKENLLRKIDELNCLKGSSLEQLVLDGNPVCDNYSDQSSYVSAIRQRFPKIVLLDGHQLPPQYGFDLDNETTLPASQSSYYSNDAARGPVPAFLTEYFGVYDGGDRQGLLGAYHDQAVMSMSASFQFKGNAPVGKDYLSNSRNLFKVSHFQRRLKLLRQGKLNVVSFLCDLPKTQHDPASFSVDVSHTSARMMTFSCSGVFKEVDSSNNHIRAFSRMFIVVPQGTGFCITNDMLFITNATPEQIRMAFKTPAPTPSPSPVPPVVSGPPALSAPLTAEQQHQMVAAFSQQSLMNTAWALKCLDENAWDYEKAASNFQLLHKSGSIPPEAFVT